ncbi:hypothetical protein [Glycomyces harbinensis]|uniref:hypothetical protein n=1 Tax=Glycomyces harbinensis TaxID=58114 RepID=UPI00115F88D8|nr:hypothetical protein [Glycomyces harbinensis]
MTMGLLLTVPVGIWIFSAVGPGVDTTVTESPSGEPVPLRATLLDIDANSECPAVIFAAESAAVADALIEEHPYAADPSGLWTEAVGAGAYAAWGLIAEFSLQSDLPQQVTVFDVRAEVAAESPPVEGGTLMTLSDCAGEGHEQMGLVLNAPEQGPFLYEDEPGKVLSDAEFFDRESIPVAAGDKATVRLEVLLDGAYPAGAYEFDLVVDYEVDGEAASVVVDAGGEPFRIATAGCSAQVVEPVETVDRPLPYQVLDGAC